jgi:hypothetical protein
VSVDCVDFPIPHAGRKFYTHKWRFHSALRYEIAVVYSLVIVFGSVVLTKLACGMTLRSFVMLC